MPSTFDMELIDDLMSTTTVTLESFDQKYKTLFAKLSSAIENREREYMDLVRTGSSENNAQSFSLQPEIRILQLVLLKLLGKIIIGKYSEPLVNLTLVLPDADATCRLLFDALEDLATHVLQARYQTNSKLFKALVYRQRTPSRETQEYALAFAPLLEQTAKISEILQKLKKEVSFIATIARIGIRSVPQSPSDSGEDDPMPLAPLNPQIMPQMAPQVPQGHFHTQSPHPPQTPPPQTPPPQTPPPQTPPPRSEDFQMNDVSATPRAPPDMTPRAPGPRNQPIMQQPPSPTIQKGKRRRVHDPEPGPSQSNDKTPGAQPTSHTGAQSNTQSNSQGPVDYLQALLNHQTKTMGELYHHLQNSTAEILKKQDQVLQKQDHKIDKVVTHLAQNTEILGRIGETLDMLSGKSKHKGSPGHQDEGDSDSQRHGSGSNQGPQPSNDGGAAAKPSDGGAAGSTMNRNNSNGDGEDGDDEGEDDNPFFRYARKKQPARSGGVKHRPAEELKIKETMRKWLNEIMEGQDQLKETVSQDEADEFTLLFKTNPLARPCSVDNF
ncbi:uncharacterized protein C8R40DRAFT_1175986 [Lentinula edodes]|uniref:uncharacterized protein n=1 Tax=Lentinula edodes TaxID=5353 RepID=UPI001E8E4CBC|nr:uncharacterized protein C8R40DRAFT_1175986 [Lentinula edodes]KAH7870075.1 hypothetical protein C8R40DRAFT_1175986 [Lentinula edodes]